MEPTEGSYGPSSMSFLSKIISQNLRKWMIGHRWLSLSSGFIVLTAITYVFSFFINDSIDWRILLFLNPDSPIPVLDDLMILITDFSMFAFGLVFVSWEIGYQVSKGSQKAKGNVAKSFRVIGMIFLVMTSSAYFWAGYEHRDIFFPLAFILFGAFWSMGGTITRYEEEKLEQINRLFWVTLLAALLTELSVEVIIKNLVARPRPLSDAYSEYNKGIRVVADEVVRGGYSYVAGHSAVFFAMVTPMMFVASRKWIKAVLFTWAILHAFSRIYLAAHFPYGSLIGSALGFSMAILVVNVFGALEGQNLRAG